MTNFNPFQSIEERLNSIENLILDLKQPNPVEPTTPQDQLLTIQEASDFLSLTVATLYSKVSKGELPVMKRSKRLYFSRTELLDYLKQGRKKTTTEIDTEAVQYLLNKKKLPNGKEPNEQPE